MGISQVSCAGVYAEINAVVASKASSACAPIRVLRVIALVGAETF